jgi:large subunit ribosomal protein L21
MIDPEAAALESARPAGSGGLERTEEDRASLDLPYWSTRNRIARAGLRGLSAGGYGMYAVIRTGGKQYRVAPGDVLKIESVASGDQTVEFTDVLAVSGETGTIARPAAAKVTAEVVGEGRGDKILVFHLKRKKQYKKLQGHRQNFTEVRIKAIEADGVTYTAAK